jgi:tetratricopeptide (TPR) repeat protein
MSYRILIIALVLGGLAGCSAPSVRKPTPTETGLLEIQRLGDSAYEEGNLLDSEKHYSVLVREIPAEAQNWFRLGNVYARTQRPDAAVAAYREAVVRNPKLTKAWYNMGIVQLRQAVNSFGELEIYAGSGDDALVDQGRSIVDGILNLLAPDADDERE